MSHYEDVFRIASGWRPARLSPWLDLPVDLGGVFQLAWWVAEEPRPAVRVVLPGDQPFNVDWARCMVEGVREGNELRIGLEPSSSRWAHGNALDRLSAQLQELPDSSVLELAVGGDVPLLAVGRVLESRWRLEAFYPAVDCAVLARALELSRESRQETGLTARDEATASAAEASLTKEWSLSEGSPVALRRQGRTLQVISDAEVSSWNRLFAGHVFLQDQEFRSAFGLQAKFDETMEEIDESEDWLQDLSQQIAFGVGQLAGIVQGQMVYSGKKATFHHSDIRGTKWLGPEEVDLSDEELRALGFKPLGDMTADGVIIRPYAGREGDCLAVVNATFDGKYLREFFSRCADGNCLTTSSLPSSENKPERKLHRQSLPELDFGDLLKAHRGRIREEGWQPEPCPTDLQTVAVWMDEYLVAWSR
jgi:hypothetical protein